MSVFENVVNAVAGWPSPSQRQHDVAVPTHCLYPSNGIVYAYVTGGTSEFRITDGGGALDEYLSRGGSTHEDISILRLAARPLGLDVTPGGVIISPLVTRDQLVGTIVLVANASKEAALSLAATGQR